MFGDLIKIFYVYEKDKADGKAIWQDRGFLGLVVGLLAVLLARYLHINLDADLQGALVVVIAGIFHLTQAHIGGVLGSVTIGKKAPPVAESAQPKAEEHNPINLSCFVFVLVLAMAAPALAAHLIIPPATCDYYIVSGLPAAFAAAADVPGDPTGKAPGSLDLSTLPEVTTDTQWTVTATCCRAQTSTSTGGCGKTASAPFTFTQDAIPAPPSGALSLAP